MTIELEKIRNQQKEGWNRFSPGWEKWNDFTMNFLQPMGDEIIHLIKPKAGETILDIAAGTGEPGLTIASINKNGTVFITDLSEQMLEIAKKTATEKRLQNIEFATCDAGELPFQNESFDAVSCRHGFMYFPDMQLAAKEMMRVLKPGGRIAATVWSGPEKNNWVTTIMSALKNHFSMPAPPPNAPSIFRCSQPNKMTGIFKNAGFKNIVQKEISEKVKFKNAEEYWNFHNDVSAPVVGALNNAGETVVNQIKEEIFETLKNRYGSGEIDMDFGSIIIYGEK